MAFWSTFGGLFVVVALWSIANPLIAAVDEASHAIKAAATVRGEFILDESGLPPGHGYAELPAIYDQLIDQQYCIAFRAAVNANCQPDFTGDLAAESPALTSAADYNPVYYLVTGLPSLLPAGEYSIYLMRLASAALACALLAMAMRTVAEIRQSHWLLVGVCLAITPMAVYLFSAINPQSVEVAGAVTLWVTMLALLRDPQPALLVRRLARITVAAVFFVNSRGLSPVFLLVLAVTAVAFSPLRNLLAVIRDRRSWPFLAVCTVSSLLAVIWIRAADTLPTGLPVVNPQWTGRRIVAITLGQTSEYIEGTLGVFGWLDTRLPDWVLFVIAGLLLSVILSGFALAGRWERVVILGLAVLVILLPVAAMYSQARYLGLIWQGRYGLPLAIGVPVLAAFVLHDRALVPPAMSRQLVRTLFVVWAGAQFVAWGVNLHRYVNGSTGSWYRILDTSWFPPLHPYALVALAAGGWYVLALVFVRVATSAATDAKHGAESDAELEADAEWDSDLEVKANDERETGGTEGERRVGQSRDLPRPAG